MKSIQIGSQHTCACYHRKERAEVWHGMKFKERARATELGEQQASRTGRCTEGNSHQAVLNIIGNDQSRTLDIEDKDQTDSVDSYIDMYGYI